MLTLPFPPSLADVLSTAIIFASALSGAGEKLRTGSLLVPGFIAALTVAGWLRSRRSSPMERVLLLGGGPLAAQLVDAFEACPHPHCALLGVVDEAPLPLAALKRCPFLGTPESLSELVRELRPNRLIVARDGVRDPLPARELLELRASGIVIEDGEEAYERLTGKVSIESVEAERLLFAEGFCSSPFQSKLARAISLGSALAGLLVFAPLFALLALAIRLDSRGPVLFRQQRIGLNGKPFDLLKFRTMRPAGRSSSEWEADNRERITRVGKWLRKSRLDELPQLVNLLRGDMNLVGPRPHPVSNSALFDARIPFYSLRCTVRPGLTGWAQVRYRYANSLAEETEKMRYDLYYIKHRTAWLDLRIIAATFAALLAGKGAFAEQRLPPSMVLARPMTKVRIQRDHRLARGA
jgi:exopolysaccharide biosynthesis polyprenyl glycosylphosphotransferase